MLAGLSQTRPRTLDELLGQRLAARLDRVDVVSRKLLQGKLPGERRSKRRGRSVEFDDFRQYVPGDDLRHVDWNILGRLDKLFIKLFREEEDLALHLIVDASASMDVGDPSKLIYACRLAAALGYVGLVNQNRVTIATFGLPAPRSDASPASAASVRRLAPMRGRSSVRRLSDFLLETLDYSARRAMGSAPPARDFADSMRTLGKASAGRGVTLLLSDFLLSDSNAAADPGAGLAYLTGSTPGAVDVYAVHLLSPGELNPAKLEAAGLVGDLRLTDVETNVGAEVTVTPATIARYRAALDTHIRTVRASCASRGIAHTLVSTDTPVDDLILTTLRQGGLLR